jgi:hypothetical protein
VDALETGRTSWTAILDAVRLGPPDDEMAVACAKLREVLDRLITAGHWRPSDPPILIVTTPATTLPAWPTARPGLPLQVLGRLRNARSAPDRRTVIGYDSASNRGAGHGHDSLVGNLVPATAITGQTPSRRTEVIVRKVQRPLAGQPVFRAAKRSMRRATLLV